MKQHTKISNPRPTVWYWPKQHQVYLKKRHKVFGPCFFTEKDSWTGWGVETHVFKTKNAKKYGLVFIGNL